MWHSIIQDHKDVWGPEGSTRMYVMGSSENPVEAFVLALQHLKFETIQQLIKEHQPKEEGGIPITLSTFWGVTEQVISSKGRTEFESNFEKFENMLDLIYGPPEHTIRSTGIRILMEYKRKRNRWEKVLKEVRDEVDGLLSDDWPDISGDDTDEKEERFNKLVEEHELSVKAILKKQRMSNPHNSEEEEHGNSEEDSD